MDRHALPYAGHPRLQRAKTRRVKARLAKTRRAKQDWMAGTSPAMTA
jgi:hypothetical protein